VRAAAVSASTVFAIALAIVAGLIFAWLFRQVFLLKPAVTKPVDDSVELTVAAANVYDQMEIKPIHVKKVRVSPKERDNYARSGKTLLTGNQPIGRVARVPVMAERPFYEEDLYPYKYPEPVKVRPGWRAAIVTIPAKEAMVQVGDYVDVYCTLSNDLLGPGGQGTAEIAKGAQVVARFGSTRPGVQPVSNSAPREYTLEVTPYRGALIELAKSMGARFGLANAPMIGEGDQKSPPPANDINDPREQAADRVSGADMAALFGISPPQSGPPPWVVEKYVGISEQGRTQYPGYVPPSRSGNGTASPTTTSPAAGPDSKPKSSSTSVPVSYAPPPQGSTMPPPPVVVMPPPPVTQGSSFASSGAVASTSRSFGFRPWRDPAAAAGCTG
jgi:Flp pilus assembly protein CpaB